MKRSSIFVLAILFATISANSQEYQLWTTLNFEGDNYEFYTLSTTNYYNQSLSMCGFGVYSDVLGIIANKNGTYCQDTELVKILALKAEQMLRSNAAPDFLTQEWIEENDIFHYSDNDIPNGVWMPTGSYDGNVDPEFQEYIVHHAINGITTYGLNNYDHRVNIYKNVIFMTFYPESTELDEFVNNFDDNYFSIISNAVTYTRNAVPIINSTQLFKDAYSIYFQKLIENLSMIQTTGFSNSQNIVKYSSIVQKNIQIMNEINFALSSFNMVQSCFENGMRAMAIKMYAEAEAEMRIEAWQKFITENPDLDQAIVDGFYEAVEEYHDYTESPIYLEIIDDIIHDTEFWKPTVSMCILALKTTILTSSTLMALGMVGHIIGGAFIAAPILFATWDVLHDGDKLLESVVCAATLEKLTIAGMPETPISNVDDMAYISVMTNIRNCLAFLFYANFSDRLDLFGGSFIARLQSGNSNYQAYEQHMMQLRDLRFMYFTVYRPDLFPITETMYGFISERCSSGILLSANFSSSENSIYQNSTIDFFDNSSGNPNSWQWTFEGGTPSTSILQNPEVTYNTIGTFDVTLTVSNGITSNTHHEDNFILVLNATTLSLGKAEPPQGNTSTNFVFSVLYKDLINQPPQYVKTIGSGWSLTMSGNGTNYSNGVQYSASKIFDNPGMYSYYYEAKTSGNQIIRYPESGFLTLNVTQNCEGWDIEVTNLTSSSSYLLNGGTVSLTATVHNNSNSPDKNYSNVPYTFQMFSPDGSVIDSESGAISSLNQTVVTSITKQLTTGSSQGNYVVIFSVYPTCDDEPSNNSASKTIIVGQAGPIHQFYVSGNQAFVELGYAPYEMCHFFNGDNYCVTNIYSDRITISQNGGDNKIIYLNDFREYNSGQVALILEGINTINSDFAMVSFGIQNEDYVTFVQTEISCLPGDEIYFEANCISNTFDNDDPDFYKNSYIEDWFDDVDLFNGNHTAQYLFTIPDDVTIGTYDFFIGCELIGGNESFIRELKITILSLPPNISSLNKYQVSADDQLIISGTNFGTSQGTVKCYNNLNATLISWNATQIKCYVPNGVQNGNLYVINSAGTSNGISYQVISSTGDPVVVQPIPDMSMDRNGSLIIADLNNTFWDPNNDPLIFDVPTSPEHIVPTINNGILTLTADNLAEGVNTITVNAKDLTNVTVQDVFLLTINSIPAFANFVSNSNQISTGQSVTFTDLSSGGISTWLWTFEGGTPATWNGQYPPQIQYNTPGTWDVTLEVGNLNSTDIEFKPDFVIVTPPPQISITPDNLNFGDVYVNQCNTKSYQLDGSNLTSNIEISAPIGFQISLQQFTGYTDFLVVQNNAGNVFQTIHVKFCPTEAQSYSGVISHVTSGVATQNLTVSGNGIDTPETFSINIPAGWSGISSYLVPVEPEFEQVMAPVNNQLIIARNFTDVYWPEFAINTIGEYNVFDGYIVKMNSPANLQFSGIKPQEKTINLTSGWNILPVLSDHEVSYQELLSQLGENLIIVTEIAGSRVIWPGAGVYSLTGLTPGQAYMIKIEEACTFNYSYLTVNPQNQDVAASAGLTTFTINTNTSWTVEESVSWFSVTPMSGIQNGILNVNYDENTLVTQRNGQITITAEGGSPVVTVTVIQAGAAPTLTVSPAYRDVTSAAGTTTFNVSSNTSWSVDESISWFSVSPMSGNNNGTLTVSYTQNTSITPRNGQLTITTDGGTPVVYVNVNQTGTDPTLTVTPLNRDVSSAAGSTTFTVTSNTTWSVTELVDWLTVTPPAGNGNSTLNVNYDANTGSTIRVGEITIATSGSAVQIMVTIHQNNSEGLIAYYPFNGNANDESGNGNITTINGAIPTSDRFGNANSAYYFDGINDEIIITPQQILKDMPAGNHSFSVWINMETSSNFPDMIVDLSNTGPYGDQRGLRIYSNYNPVFKWVTNSGSFNAIFNSGLQTNTWYNIVGVLNGNQGSLYINGDLVASNNSTGQPNNISMAKIGNISTGGTYNNFFHGKIDDLRLYNRALSEQEVYNLYGFR